MVRRVKLHYQATSRVCSTLASYSWREQSPQRQLLSMTLGPGRCGHSDPEFAAPNWQIRALAMDVKGILRAGGSRRFLNSLGSVPIEPQQQAREESCGSIKVFRTLACLATKRAVGAYQDCQPARTP